MSGPGGPGSESGGGGASGGCLRYGHDQLRRMGDMMIHASGGTLPLPVGIEKENVEYVNGEGGWGGAGGWFGG